MAKKSTIEVPAWQALVAFVVVVLLAGGALKRCAGNQSTSVPGIV